VTTRAEIVAEARTWLGTPFVHQGRARGVAVDCLGVVAMVGRALGLTDYDRTDYGRIPNPRRMRAELRVHLAEIPLAEARPGDVVHLAWSRQPMHLGILTEEGILHAYSAIPAVVEHPLDDAWRGRFRFAYRYPGVA
jgi:NlpC/P60 family putative phage cell wall peptidase